MAEDSPAVRLVIDIPAHRVGLTHDEHIADATREAITRAFGTAAEPFSVTVERSGRTYTEAGR